MVRKLNINATNARWRRKTGVAKHDHIYTKTVSAPLSLTIAVPIVFPDLNILITPSQEHFNSQYHSPPDVRSNNFAVYNSVFRI